MISLKKSGGGGDGDGIFYDYSCMLFYPLSFIYYISSIYLENVLHNDESEFYKGCKSNDALFYSLALYFACFLLKMEGDKEL